MHRSAPPPPNIETWQPHAAHSEEMPHLQGSKNTEHFQYCLFTDHFCKVQSENVLNINFNFGEFYIKIPLRLPQTKYESI